MRLSTRSLSQPEPAVPAMLNMAMATRSQAPVSAGMPLSMQAGIRWVPISPLVEAPQQKKLPASNQKSRVRAASASVRNDSQMGLPDAAAATGFGPPASP